MRATIEIAGIEVEVFQLPSGEYVMSQTQVTEAIDLQSVYILRFLESKQSKALPGNDSEFYTLSVEGSNKPINVVPTKVVSDFWLEQVAKGNTKAFALVNACMQEALERRCDNAFGVNKTEQQYEQQTSDRLTQWQQTRQYLLEQHNAFTYTCRAYGFPPARTHNKLSMETCGMTASQLRQIEEVCGDKNVGLNHIQNVNTLKKVARVKYHFSRYRKGSVEERISRALKDFNKEEKTS
ncbi:hypothetical protein [Nostoc sp. LEGE 06077]|uniref:hypothetical protein n=1 Tax=Nostoc sp. LEGE 06077 TaxID=915325 RepID=UPI00187F0B86|nr:hypothetical protein [Nostoc sp. LEGE 06077]